MAIQPNHKFRIFYALVGFILVCGLVSGSVTATYSAAGKTEGAGGVSQDISISSSTRGNMTTIAGYESSLHGRGGVQLASETLIEGKTFDGTTGLMVDFGRFIGSASSFIFQNFLGEDIELEGTGDNETDSVLPSEICQPLDPEELPFQNQYCDLVESDVEYSISSGTLGIQTTVSYPGYVTGINQQAAMAGSGDIMSYGGYLNMGGQNFTRDSVEEFAADTRMTGRDMEFASSFVYKSSRG